VVSGAKVVERSANQQDVARAAGVSVSTASRALANSRSGSAELRNQIQQLAAELGYRARGVAETPISARVYVTGNVMSGGLVSFYSEILEGMNGAAREAGISLDVRPGPPVFDTEKVRRDAENDPAGATFFVGLDPGPRIAELLPAGQPVILVNSFDPDMLFDCVAPNNFYGAQTATQRLLDAGHRHIAIAYDYRSVLLRRPHPGSCTAMQLSNGDLLHV